MRAGMVGLALAVVLAGCRAQHAPLPASPPLHPATRHVAVIPFRVARGTDAQPVAPVEFGTKMARVLARRLREAGAVVADPDAVIALTPTGKGDDDPAQLAVQVGRWVGATRAVYGTLTRYHEREGTAWSVATPASVAYEATLVRALDGVVLAADRFDFTQHALSENLLDLPRFLRGGGRWLTGPEILDGALTETARRFAAALDGSPPGDAGRRRSPR